MRRAELLIAPVQRATENERAGTSDGISLEDYYRFFTEAVRCLQRQIMSVHPAAFRKSVEAYADGVEELTLPDDIFSSNRVVSLEYSSSGNVEDYRKLERRTAMERSSGTGDPYQYIVRGRGLLVNRTVGSGMYRLTYDYLLPAVDKRRATVATAIDTDDQLASLVLSTGGDAFALSDYLTICDFDGAVKMRGIPYTAVAVDGTVTLAGGPFTYPQGSTIAVGDYVCLGSNASTHPLVEDCCEDFVIAYAVKRIFNRDSSDDAIVEDAELKRMLGEILDVYGTTPDVEEIPLDCGNDYFGDV